METLFSKEKYLVILQIIEEDYSFNLRKAKELFEAGDFEALHEIVVACQWWLWQNGISSAHLSGIATRYHPNGMVYFKTSYSNGLQVGLYEEFYANGKIRERYKRNHKKQLHGAWEWFDENGQLKERKSGVGETWHHNGQLRSRGPPQPMNISLRLPVEYSHPIQLTYVDGEENGVWEFFHENGQPYTCGTYVNGKRHGAWEWFDDNGRIYMRGSYVYGEFSPIPL